MAIFVWIGDEKDDSIGKRLKSQVVMFEGEGEAYNSNNDSYYAYGDVGDQMINSKGGNDVIVAAQSATNNFFVGDSTNMLGSTGGNDELVGSDFAKYNELFGDAISASESKCGNDVLIGGNNAFMSRLYGDAVYLQGGLANMSFGGNDTLFSGGVRVGYMYGDAYFAENSFCGNDDLVAGDFVNKNFMYGDGYLVNENVWGGNDRLVSGTGSDSMWGDFEFSGADTKFGRDTFAFKDNNGQDKIFDFRSGEDRIEIQGIAGLADFSQLQMQITVQDGSSIITLGTDDTVTVIGVTNLQAQDFIFS